MNTSHEGPERRRRTREEAIEAAGKTFAAGRRQAAALTPREQAEAAYTPTGPSVDELEDRIRARRGLPPKRREEVVDE